MAIYHCSIKIISRSSGKSAVASAAYRSGTKLRDEETGLTHDYGRKGGIIDSEIMLCENAPAEYANREVLWNAVHQIEKRSDAQLAREFEVALPRELTHDEMKELVRDYCKPLVEAGMCVDWAIHDKGDGNPHAHILTTTRPIKENGEWGVKQKTVFALDENGQKIPVLNEDGTQKVRVRKGKGEEKQWLRTTVDATGWNSKDKLMEWRYNWEVICNYHLEREIDGEIQQIATVDCRSHADRGIDRLPTIHEGYAARQIEQDGGVAERCEHNRSVRAANQSLDRAEAELRLSLLQRLTAVVTAIRDKLQKPKEKIYSMEELWEMARRGQKAPEPSQQKQPEPTNTPPAPAPIAPEPLKIKENPPAPPKEEQAVPVREVSDQNEVARATIDNPKEAKKGLFGAVRDGISSFAAKQAEKAAQRAAEVEARRRAEAEAKQAEEAAKEAARAEARKQFDFMQTRVHLRKSELITFVHETRDSQVEYMLKDLDKAKLERPQAIIVPYADGSVWRFKEFGQYEWEKARDFMDKTEDGFTRVREVHEKHKGRTVAEVFRDQLDDIRAEQQRHEQERQNTKTHDRPSHDPRW